MIIRDREIRTKDERALMSEEIKTCVSTDCSSVPGAKKLGEAVATFIPPARNRPTLPLRCALRSGDRTAAGIPTASRATRLMTSTSSGSGSKSERLPVAVFGHGARGRSRARIVAYAPAASPQ